MNTQISTRKSHSPGWSRGIAIFEMTVLTLTASTILLVLAQGTLLFTRAAELKNLAHTGSQYAASNPGFDIPTIKSFILQGATGTIGANGGSALTITVNPSTTPRRLGTPVTVTVAYSYDQAQNFGANALGLNFPSTLTSSDTGATQ
jgi:hypothetical protein